MEIGFSNESVELANRPARRSVIFDCDFRLSFAVPLVRQPSRHVHISTVPAIDRHAVTSKSCPDYVLLTLVVLVLAQQFPPGLLVVVVVKVAGEDTAPRLPRTGTNAFQTANFPQLGFT